MNAKKLLLSLFVLVTCLFCYGASFDWSVDFISSASVVRVSDSVNLESGKEFSFRAGVSFSKKNAVFASCSVLASGQILCFQTFKTPGDTVMFSFNIGYSRRLGTDYLLLSTGPDFLFSSSLITRVNCLWQLTEKYDRFVTEIGDYRLFFSLSLKEAYSNGFCCVCAGIGFSLRGKD